MNRIVPLLLLIPTLVNAQALDLVCVDKGGASVSFSVDTETKTVKVGPMPARNVTIDSN